MEEPIINKESEERNEEASSSQHLHETSLQDEWPLEVYEKGAYDRNVKEGQ